MRFFTIIIVSFLITSCGKETPKSQERPPTEVTVITVEQKDTPVSSEYVGQTESSHQVQIVARVNGFIEKRLYTEGDLVKAGEIMFQQDPKPFQAEVSAAKGAKAEQLARLQTAKADLERVKPLAKLNALSQKDLDDATGREQAASAAVQMANADLEKATLDLGYTTIRSPVTGLSSFSHVQEGAYVNQSNNLLTYVSKIDPIWVKFTLSENELLAFRNAVEDGKLRRPKDNDYEVEAILADGTLYPHKGRITFSDADFNQETGTYLLRATLPNKQLSLRPGQFVRVRVSGNVRPNAILVPQKSVMQGAQGHFVFVIKDGKTQSRNVTVGEWLGDQWFIEHGLEAGDVVVTEGMMKLAPGASVKTVAASTPISAPDIAAETTDTQSEPADKAANKP